jgi:hypothetical protein
MDSLREVAHGAGVRLYSILPWIWPFFLLTPTHLIAAIDSSHEELTHWFMAGEDVGPGIGRRKCSLAPNCPRWPLLERRWKLGDCHRCGHLI